MLLGPSRLRRKSPSSRGRERHRTANALREEHRQSRNSSSGLSQNANSQSGAHSSLRSSRVSRSVIAMVGSAATAIAISSNDIAEANRTIAAVMTDVVMIEETRIAVSSSHRSQWLLNEGQRRAR